jgi:hypothetical protein
MRVAALLKPAALFVLISAAAALTSAQQSGESVIIRQGLAKDLYLAARDVRVLAPVEGDLVAAGQSIAIEGEVTGDLIMVTLHCGFCGGPDQPHGGGRQ